ncbi:MAG: hypothetical protein GX898_10570 [Corynebacterium sp.]|nr:hypothetical protein [Corynebacterium sp.]
MAGVPASVGTVVGALGTVGSVGVCAVVLSESVVSVVRVLRVVASWLVVDSSEDVSSVGAGTWVVGLAGDVVGSQISSVVSVGVKVWVTVAGVVVSSELPKIRPVAPA